MSRWIVAGVTFASILILPASIFLPFLPVLVVTDYKTAERVFCCRLGQGDEFELSYVHSVNRRPVVDTLTVENESLTIIRSRFDHFGAGMPDQSGEGTTLSVEPDGSLLWTVNRCVPEINVAVGRVSDQVLRVRGTRIPLASLAEPGSSLTFRPSRYSLYTLWKGRCLR